MNQFTRPNFAAWFERWRRTGRGTLPYYLVIILVGLLALREEHEALGRSWQRQFAQWTEASNEKRQWQPLVLFVAHDESNAAITGLEELSAMDAALFINACKTINPKVVGIASPIASLEGGELLKTQLTGDHPILPRLNIGYFLDGDRPIPLALPAALPDKPDPYPLFREFSGMRQNQVLHPQSGFLNLQKQDSAQSLIPLVGTVSQQLVASFALRNTMIFFDLPALDVRLKRNHRLALTNAIDFPLTADGMTRILPEADSVLETTTLDQLLLDISLRKQELLNKYAGYAIILGRNDVASQTIPLEKGKNCSPAYYQALATASLIASGSFAKTPKELSWLLLLISLPTFAVLIRMKPTDARILLIIVSCLYLLAAIACRAEWQVQLPFLLPVAVNLTLFCLHAVYIQLRRQH